MPHGVVLGLGRAPSRSAPLSLAHKSLYFSVVQMPLIFESTFTYYYSRKSHMQL